MHGNTYANICIYVHANNSTYTNTLTFNSTQTYAHIHTNNPTFRTKNLPYQC